MASVTGCMLLSPVIWSFHSRPAAATARAECRAISMKLKKSRCLTGRSLHGGGYRRNATNPAVLNHRPVRCSANTAPPIPAHSHTHPSSKPAAGPSFTWGSLGLMVLQRQPALLVIGLTGMLVAATGSLFIPVLSGTFTQALFSGNSFSALVPILRNLAILYVAELAGTIVYVSSMSRIGEDIISEVTTRMFQALVMQRIEYFDQHNVAELTTLFSVEIGNLRNLVANNLSRDRGLRSSVEIIGSVAILWRLCPDMAPIFMALVVTMAVTAASYSLMVQGTLRAVAADVGKLSREASESLRAVRTVRSYAGEMYEMSQFNGVTALLTRRRVTQGMQKAFLEAMNRFAIYCSVIANYIVGGHRVLRGAMEGSVLIAYVGYTFTLTFGIQGLVNTWADVAQCSASLQRMAQLVKDPPAPGLSAGMRRVVDEGNLPTPPVDGREVDYLSTRSVAQAAALAGTGREEVMPGPRLRQRNWKAKLVARQSDLVLRDVCFAYPSSPDRLVLQDINLVLPRGTMTALVGRSGSGKSTIAQLIVRFYEPSGGFIGFGEENVSSFDLAEWAEAVAYVSQDPVLFSSSVFNNIAYGAHSSQATMEEVVAAARMANAHEFICELPQGYDTVLGEGGSILSGGQRQRIVIARALLKDSPILVLDEATSALDTKSEQLVQQALERLVQGRTTLVIAHRLSTVQSAHQIVVLHDGRITEIGSHASLVERGGEYAELVNTQRLSFED